MTKAAQLRSLIAKGAVAMPGVPNASMARQVERAGFDAVYISGAGLANSTAGLPDVGLLTLTEVAMLAGFIAHAVKIPAIVDADTGFGGAENIGRTIYELERAGLAGCHLEDQEFPKRCGHLAGKAFGRDGRNGRKDSRGRRRETRSRFPGDCTDRFARAGEFRRSSETRERLCRRRRGCDFSRGAADERGISRFRPGSESPAPREHDRVRQEPVAQCAGTRRSRLSHGHLSAERLPHFDEGNG